MLTAGKVFVWMACFSLCIVSLSAELQRFQHSVKDDGSLSFLVIGDWGRRGFFNQSKVAHQMGRIGEEMKIDFVVSSGDNFYNNGLISTEDPLFEDSFSKIYTANSLQKQWYSVLGNHDYRGDVEVQLSPILRRKDSRWLCLRSYVLHTEIADFFFVDTTPFVDKYFLKPSYHRYDWRGVLPRDKYLTMLLKDLELAMKESSAEWQIVVGHHTMRSIGHHGNTKELLRRLLPVLEANNVDMYINGHDHCLQHITSTKSPIHFLTSGGGSKAWKGRLYERKQEDFFYDGQGFMAVHLTQSAAKVAFYDIFGQVTHHFNLSKMYHTAM